MLDIYLIAIFFILLLYTSYRYGRNIKTVSEYALADRKLPLPILAMTFMATYVGVSLFLSTTANIFDDGIVQVLFLLQCIPLFLFWAYIMNKRFDMRFKDHLTIGDMFKYFLGRKIEKVTSIIYIVFMVMVFALQITAIGKIGTYLFGQSYAVVTITAVIILLTYTTLCGMRAVAITDIVQFSFMILLIPYIANHAVNTAGGMNTIFTAESLKLENLSNFSIVSSYTFQFIECTLPYVLLFPQLVQRFLMTSVNHRQHQMKFISLSMLVLSLIIVISMMVIAFSAVQIYPEEQSNIIFARIMKETLPEGAKGIVMIGLLSAIMSTADSIINSSSVLFVNNLLPKELPEKRKLHLMMLVSIILGIIGCFIALYIKNPMQIISYMGSICILSAYVLFLGIMRVKIEKTSFWIGFWVDVFFVIILREFYPNLFTTAQDTFILDFSGIIAFTISNIVINKGIKFLHIDSNKRIKKVIT